MYQIAFTGSPWGGKTTIIKKLAEEGIPVIIESETQLVKGMVHKYGSDGTGKWILNNYFKFKTMVAERQKVLEQEISNEKIVLYDRTAIDWIAYCNLRNSKIPPLLEELSIQYKFGQVLFFNMLDGFDERRNQGRIMKKEEAIKLNNLILEEYKSRGYSISFIPKMDLNPRIELVKKHIQKYLKV